MELERNAMKLVKNGILLNSNQKIGFYEQIGKEN